MYKLLEINIKLIYYNHVRIKCKGKKYKDLDLCTEEDVMER